MAESRERAEFERWMDEQYPFGWRKVIPQQEQIVRWESWQAATAAERERCAKIAKQSVAKCESKTLRYQNLRNEIADAIRKGGE